MSSIWEHIWQGLTYAFKVVTGVITSISLRPVDVLDIAVVAFIIYKGIQLIRETRAEQLFKGFTVLLLAYVVARVLSMQSLLWIFNNIVFQVGIVALLVVFQPELRRALEKVGRSSWANIGKSLTEEETERVLRGCIDAVCKACAEFSKTKTGALIVFERSTMLGDIINTGTLVNADCSQSLLMNVFYPKSPLHDGAVILRGGRIFAASCILPLSENTEISRDLGTRHRAALGISEISDAIVIIVSEETGIISVTQDGVIKRGFTAISLYAFLEKVLMGDPAEQGTGTFSAIRRKLIQGRKKPREK